MGQAVKFPSGDLLISDEYRELNRQLHEDRPDYGTSGHKYADMVLQIAMAISAETVLDYGAGKCTLQNALPQLAVISYDPCVEGLDVPPEPADLVICSDVMEHVEPDMVESVISNLRRLTNKVLFVNIATGPANKTLSDGRNAHICIQSPEWWLDKFKDMRMDTFNRMGNIGFVASFSKEGWDKQ